MSLGVQAIILLDLHRVLEVRSYSQTSPMDAGPMKFKVKHVHLSHFSSLEMAFGFSLIWRSSIDQLLSYQRSAKNKNINQAVKRGTFLEPGS